MRYADSGGLSPEQRAEREAVRMQAATMFEQGATPVEVARELRVTRKSAYAWRRAWQAGGTAALASTGPGGLACRLDDRQRARLEAALRAGPAVHGWDDQRWTLARVATVIERMFGVSYSLPGVSVLVHRMGWSVRRPVHRLVHRLVHRPVERDEEAIRRWREEVWPQITAKAAALGAWICFEDEAGQSTRPAKARTWARRGQTPVIPVSGKGAGKVSIAGMVCAKPGQDTRLAYLMRRHTHRVGERRSLSEEDYAALLRAADEELNAPMILVWDNLNTHVSTAMRAFLDADADWLSVYRLPTYAPEINPAEGVWANRKGRLRSLAAAGLGHLGRAVEAGMQRMQGRPELLDGFIAETGLVLASP